MDIIVLWKIFDLECDTYGKEKGGAYYCTYSLVHATVRGGTEITKTPADLKRTIERGYFW